MVDPGNDSQDLNMPLISQLTSGELIVVNHRWFVNLTEAQLAALGSTPTWAIPFFLPHGQVSTNIYSPVHVVERAVRLTDRLAQRRLRTLCLMRL